jgi:hypothetical protein
MSLPSNGCACHNTLISWYMRHATNWTTGETVRFSAEARHCSLLHRIQNGSAVYTAFCPMCTGGKENWPDDDHSSSVEVNNVWRSTYTKLYIFMAWRQINEAGIYLDLYINYMHIYARKRKDCKKYFQWLLYSSLKSWKPWTVILGQEIHMVFNCEC